MNHAGRKPLPDGEAIKRSLANMRVAASTSFTEEEIVGLETLFATIRRGGDPKLIARSAPMLNVQKKLQTMLATVERQKRRRELKASGALEVVETAETPATDERSEP